MEQNDLQINEAAEEIYSKEQVQELANNELAIVPESDRKEIATVAKQEDLLLISTTKKKISNFKRRFPAKNFVITDDLKYDKATLDKATEQWREVKNWRTKEAEVAIKKLKDPYVKLVKFYNDTFNPLIADVKAIEKPISDFVDKLEELKKEEDQKEEREKEARTTRRVDEIIKAGASFDGNFYSIGSEEFEVATISLGMSDINSLTDDLYSKILSDIIEKSGIIKQKQSDKDAEAFRKENERIAADQLEKDNLKKEQEKLVDRLLVLKEKNTRIRGKELKFLNMVFNDQWNAYLCGNVKITVDQVENSSDEDWEGLISDAEHKIETEKETETKKQRFSSRATELVSLGFSKNVATSSYKVGYKDNSAELNYAGIETYSDADWIRFIEQAKRSIDEQNRMKIEDERITKEKEQLAKERETTLAPYWQFVSDTEKKTLGDLDDKTFDFLLASKQKMNEDDLQLKKQQKDDSDKLELAKKGDKAMYEDYVGKLGAIDMPPVTTVEYKNKISKIRDFIITLY